MPTLGKSFAKGMDTLSWSFGRHPEWCDVVWGQKFSAIHFTIFYDRSASCWFIYDGGFYPKALTMKVPKGYAPVRQQTTEREPGPNPSTLGTFLNGKKLSYTQPTDGSSAEPRIMSLHPGDRVFAAGKKIYVFDRMTVSDLDWHTTWIEEDCQGQTISPGQAKELLAQQQAKAPDPQAYPPTLVSLGSDFLKFISTPKTPLGALYRLVLAGIVAFVIVAVMGSAAR